jgi:hypothetical protein
VVKQVYRVKRDNRKDKSSDLSSSDTKSNVTITTSANIDKDVKQQVGDAQGAIYEPMELEVSKVERNCQCLNQKHNRAIHSVYLIGK